MQISQSLARYTRIVGLVLLALNVLEASSVRAQTVKVNFQGNFLNAFSNGVTTASVTLNGIPVTGTGTGENGAFGTSLGTAWLETNQPYTVTLTISGYCTDSNTPALWGTARDAILFSTDAGPCVALSIPEGSTDPLCPLLTNAWRTCHGLRPISTNQNSVVVQFNISVSTNAGQIHLEMCGESLVADGKSSAKASTTRLLEPVTWSAEPGDMVTFSTFTNDAGRLSTLISSITNKLGTVKIIATGANGCIAERMLDIEDAEGGGCAPCNRSGLDSSGQSGDSSVFGTASYKISGLQSVGLSISLGTKEGGKSAHSLELPLQGDTVGDLVSALRLPWSTENFDIFGTVGTPSLRQIRVPSGLVKIDYDPIEPQILFYANQNVGPRMTNGYTVTGSALVVYSLTKLAAPVGLSITEAGETYRYSDFISDEDGNWHLDTPDATEYFEIGSPATGVRSEKRTTVADTTVRYQEKHFTSLASGERLTLEVLGAGADAHTNSYSYYTNGLLERVVRDDGSWEHYFYDTQMRPIQIFSSHGNQGPTTNRTLCRLIEHKYDTNLVSGSGDAGVYHPSSPRRTIEYLLNEPVSVQFQSFAFGETRRIQCLSTNLAGVGNLTNITTYYTSGFFFDMPKSVEHPDGRMEFYEYTYGGNTTNYTNTVYTGVPGTAKTNIVDGTKTVTVKGPLGQLISVTTTDIASTNKVIARQLYGAFDVYSRPQAVTNLDGTWEYSARFCCGDTVTTNREGTVTTKTYDVMNRLLTTTVNGVTHSNTYDAAGSLLKVERIGTNGNVIVVQRNGYDTAGHVTATTNALGEVTLFEEAHGLSGSTNITTRLTNSSSGPQRIEARYLDGQTKSITGGLAHPVGYEYGPTITNGGGTFTKEIKLDASGSATGEWTIQFYDLLGRPYKTLYADGASSQTFYNLKGQPTNSVNPDNVSRLTSYNSLGQPAYTAIDSNLNAAIDLSGNDRVQRTTNYVANNGVADVHRSITYQLSEGGSEVWVNTTETSVDGLRSWSITPAGTSSTRTFYPGGGVRIQMSWRVDGSYASNYFVYGRLLSSTHFNAAGSQLGGTTFAYDAHGRQIQSIDARNGATTNSFNDLDQITSTTTPGPFYLQTQTQYDSLGRPAIITHPDNRSVTNEYYPSGELKKTSGARTYPVEYTYDPQGRMKTMKTWQEFGNEATAAVTGWTNDSLRGWLNAKGYADGKGPSYSYTSAGRLSQRTWARGVTTSYAMNAFGDIERITYSDAITGNVTNTFDRRGRVTGINQGNNVTTRLYSEAGLLLSETQNGIVVSNRYDELLRRTNVAVVVSGVVVASTGYGYDGAGRLATVTDGTNSATYSYVANSPLIGQILFQHITTNRMTTSKSYDYLNRLTLITNATGSENPSFAYAHNSANQRTAITNENAAQWLYGYDTLGQVTNGTRRWSDGSPVLGQQFAYLFDDIGNRRTAISGGDANGNHLRLQTYSANALNQYTSRTVPGWLDVIGTATNAATVTVNNTVASRKSDYYRAEVSVPNSGAVWQPITNVAVLASGTNDYVTNWTGNVFVPKTPEQFLHDLDGNLTSDGRWTNRWDGENRLLSQTSHVGGPSGSRYDLRHGYDSQSRRISKVVSNWTGSAWVKLYEQRFVYDGWNLLAILNENNAVQVSFAWGTDLSGSMQGAGGVGGLISMTVHNGAWAGTYFYAFDGNGNVAALISAYDGSVVARYEYDPFHRLLRATGPLAFTNPFVASTKFCDWETGLLYYGYRYYDPNIGRWWGRDPIEERGGKNLFGFVGNEPTQEYDILGQESACQKCQVLNKCVGGARCRVKSGPSYYPSGRIPILPLPNGGRQSTPFFFRAEFSDNLLNGECAGCCEVQQYTMWSSEADRPLNTQFEPPEKYPPNVWVEDRDDRNMRYGVRLKEDPLSMGERWSNQYYGPDGKPDFLCGSRYFGVDQPRDWRGKKNGWVKFQVRVVDKCNGNKLVVISESVIVDWGFHPFEK